MIHANSYKTALSFAEQLASKGQVATVFPGSLLGELVRLSAPEFSSPLATDEDLMNVGVLLQATTEGSLDSATQHSRELDAYIKDLGKLVTTHVSYAKNVIRPHVTELAEAIVAYLSDNRPKEASEQFSIQSLRLAAVLKDESFLDSLSYYKDKSVLTPDLSFSLEPKSREELTELVMTGSDRIDQLIVEWLSHLPGDYLVNTWNSFFTKTQTANGVLSYGDVTAMNAFERADQCLALYLLARKITDQVQSESIPLNAYKNIALQYTDYAGAALVDALKRIALSIKTKGMVLSVDNARKCAKVNGEIYGPWLEAGNSPEVILGLIVSGNQPSSMDLIDQNAEEYKRQWNSYVTFFNTSESNKSFQYTKDFIAAKFAEFFSNRDAVEEEFVVKNPAHVTSVVKRVQEEVDGLKTSDLKDPYAVALCLVAKHRFHYTSAYQILSDIHEAGHINPNVDVREAALLAVVNYVADYLAAQMTVSS